jgi:DNA (cytosine-5)-methyltransferase 1
MYTLQAGKHHGVAGTMQAGGKAAGSATQQDAESGMLVAYGISSDCFDRSGEGASRSAGERPGLGISEETSPALRAKRPNAVAYGGNNTRGPIDVATAVNAHGGPHGRQDFESETFVAFDCKASGRNGFGVGDVSPTLRAMGHADSHQNAGGQVAVAFDTTQITSRANYSNPQPGDPCHPLASGAHPPAITGVAVRRLTPMECERLQGMPDGHTLVPYRGKPAADGPRYRVIGNSWAVPKFRWVGERLAFVDQTMQEQAS